MKRLLDLLGAGFGLLIGSPFIAAGALDNLGHFSRRGGLKATDYFPTGGVDGFQLSA